MSTDSQALVSQPNPLVVIPNDQDLMEQGGIGLESIYIKPTFVQLVQNTTRNEEAEAGKLYDALTKTNFDYLDVIPLGYKTPRSLFPEGGELGSKPLCRSDDGVVPSPYVEYPQSNSCGNCSKSSWDSYNKATGKGKPTCKQGYQLLFILKEMGLPRLIQLNGMSIPPFKDLMENIKQSVETARFQGKGLHVNLFSYTFRISSEKKVGKLGTYYIAKFSNVMRLADPAEFKQFYIDYVISKKAREAEREAQQAEAAVFNAIDTEGPTITI